MKRILFMVVPLLLVLIAFRPDEPISVTGHVTDGKGAAMRDVYVSVKGTSTTTVTAADGSYSITAPDKNSTLVFSFVGFNGHAIRINGRKVIDVVMQEAEAKAMNEVVVMGYGVAKRKSVTGSVSAVRSRQLIYTDDAIAAAPLGYHPEQNEDGIADIDDMPINFNTEGYDNITENHFVKTADHALSTFSIDVDAASYSNVRRMLKIGQLPPAGAVRIEEMVNYFNYDYSQPAGKDPFAIHTEVSAAPWNKAHKLVLVGLQGKVIPNENLPASNLVFLIDVSGSMDEPSKLGLVKSSMQLLTKQLREKDHVSIVVYAGAAGLVLPPTPGNEQARILDAIERLQAGGSTAGGAGLRLAYKTATGNFIKGGNNRVILCTDGDFNVGESSDDAMERLIEQERNTGVFLTVLGYGMGNYQDSKMQKLADKGNGNHAYIDNLSEARKVLVSEFGGTLFTIAKDVKLQVEFNPAKVQGYRLIGYENRMLAKEDFNNDKKDAGELGSGHTVTALYEIIPVGVNSLFLKDVNVDPYRYQQSTVENTTGSEELMNIRFRYKEPDGTESKLISHPVMNKQTELMATSDNFRFAASVAEFGMLLRQSAFMSDASYTQVLELARSASRSDLEGYRAEFTGLVRDAQALAAAIRRDDTKKIAVSR